MGVVMKHPSINMSTTPPSATSAAATRLSNYTVTPSDNATDSTATTVMTSTIMTSLCQNGSAQLCPCPSPAPGNHTRGMMSDEDSLDALLYIVVVLLFYAFSIVVLMVKYIRRENKEAYLRQYFDEFVAREHFQSAQARNQICLKTLMDKHAGEPQLKDYVQLDTAQAQVELIPPPPPPPPPTPPPPPPPPPPPTRLNQDGDVLFSIPEAISELAEEEEEEFESAEDELLDEWSQTNTSVRTETEQMSSLEELLPPHEMPV